MKKIIARVLIYTLLIIACTSLGIIGMMNKPSDTPDESILNIDYYKYNSKTGNYEELKLTDKKIEYKGELLELNSCKNYTYKEETGIIKLDCKKAFRIVGYTEEVIVINMNQENHYFYKTKEKSYNGEFQRIYQMTMESYKQSGEKELEGKIIDLETLDELLTNKKTSYIYIKGKNCKNMCTLFNKTFINFSSEDNTYYIDLTKIELDEELLNKLPDDIKEIITNYSEENPIVLVIENNELKETIKIEGKGFDYSKYENYTDGNEVNNG